VAQFDILNCYWACLIKNLEAVMACDYRIGNPLVCPRLQGPNYLSSSPIIARLVAALCFLGGLLLTITGQLQAQTPGALTQGQPIVANTAGTASDTKLSSSALFLDASQFTGSPDICLQINNAYQVFVSAGVGGTIDARSLVGTAGAAVCQSNPLTGGNQPVLLLLGSTTIVASNPWFTPQLPHTIKGVTAGGISTGGTVIQECGPGATGWSNTTMNCSVNGTTVNAFPNGDTTMTFHVAHGPFIAGTYSCLICDGGETAAGNGKGWETNAFAGRVEDVKLDLGGNSNTFGYYTQNEQERSGVYFSNCGHGGTSNWACVFWDRTEAPTGQSGPDNFGISDFNMGPNLSASTASGYGVVSEGSNITITFTQGGCASLPSAYVTTVGTGGVISAISVGNKGGSGCGTPTCTITGAPTAFNGTGSTGATCTVTVTGGVVTAVAASGTGNTLYPRGVVSYGAKRAQALTLTGSPTGNIQDAFWTEGYADSQVKGLHCEFISGYCLHISNGSGLTQGGTFQNVDTSSTISGGQVYLGYSIDNNQTIESIVNATGSASFPSVVDAPNNITLVGSDPRWKNGVARYQPGTLTATGSIGGALLAAGACSSGTVSLANAQTGSAVVATPSTYPLDGFWWEAYVSAPQTVKVNVRAAVGGTPTASVYNVQLLQ
jgi:hypothetical protein